MRIKFRAWKHVSTPEMFNDVQVIDFKSGIAHLCYSLSSFTERTDKEKLDNLILMQYTGLKDKNGTEIYEGDILSTDLDRPYLIVEFRNGAFMFQCHDNGKDYYDFMATTGENSNFTKYHEVIGNIYENPELLSDSQ